MPVAADLVLAQVVDLTFKAGQDKDWIYQDTGQEIGSIYMTIAADLAH